MSQQASTSLPSAELVREIFDDLFKYCQKLLQVLGGEQPLAFGREQSPRFNARVDYDRALTYTITLFDGCVSDLHLAIAELQSETVDDTMAALSVAIFGKPGHELTLLRHILFSSLIFIILHEFAHIVGGHFAFLIDNGFASRDEDGFHFDEVSSSPLPPLPQDWATTFKLLELDADETAFDLMMLFGYEIFAANEDVREAIGVPYAPDAVPMPVERALYDLSLCAASIALFAIHGRRGYSPNYPMPLTRVLNLSYFLTAKLAFPDVRGEGRIEVRLDEERRAVFQKSVIPSVYNALEFARACCINLGIDSGLLTLPTSDRVVTEIVLINDWLALFLRDDRPLRTPEATELDQLLLAKRELRRKLAPYRQRDWWKD